jgi:hypothetical protein
MDEDELNRLAVRVRVLETLVAFQFAAQHMQTPDPAAAVRRLRAQLIERARETLPDLDADLVAAEFEAALGRILELQEQLPKRLVD